MDNQIKVYNGMPEKGLHYLFKDVDETMCLIKSSKYMITLSSIEHEMINRGIKLRVRKADPLDSEAGASCAPHSPSGCEAFSIGVSQCVQKFTVP